MTLSIEIKNNLNIRLLFNPFICFSRKIMIRISDYKTYNTSGIMINSNNIIFFLLAKNKIKLVEYLKGALTLIQKICMI